MGEYVIGVVGLLIIGAILWRYVLALCRWAFGLGVLVWLLWSVMHANVTLAELRALGGFLGGAVAGFVVVGVICSRGIYRMLVRRDEQIEIERARKRAIERM